MRRDYLHILIASPEIFQKVQIRHCCTKCEITQNVDFSRLNYSISHKLRGTNEI